MDRAQQQPRVGAVGRHELGALGRRDRQSPGIDARTVAATPARHVDHCGPARTRTRIGPAGAAGQLVRLAAPVAALDVVPAADRVSGTASGTDRPRWPDGVCCPSNTRTRVDGDGAIAVVIAVTAPGDVLTDLQRFEMVVLAQLQQVGLPRRQRLRRRHGAPGHVQQPASRAQGHLGPGHSRPVALHSKMTAAAGRGPVRCPR